MPVLTWSGPPGRRPYAERVTFAGDEPLLLRRGLRPPSRWLMALTTGIAVAAITVPAMVGIHMTVAAAVPRPATLALAAVLVVLVVALVESVAAPAPEDGRRTTRVLLASLAGQLAGHAVFAASSAAGGCLPVMGRGASLGLNLALLREDPSCPAGTFVVTGMATTAASVLVGAVLVLLAQVLTGGLSAAAVHSADRAVHLLCGLAGQLIRLAWLARLLARLDGRVPVAAAPAPIVVDGPDRPDHFHQWVGAVGVLRGPPLAQV